jgi:hypothetical protein
MTARLAVLLGSMLAAAVPCAGQDTFDRTRDRGTGVPLSIFGTYVTRGELIVYPFYEYYRDGDYEYEAGELGYGTDTTEFRGRFRGHEGLIFVAYGISQNVAVELEAAMMSATLQKSPHDSTVLPPTLKQSGLGDVEAQLRWRWKTETDSRPEWFSYFETVFPFQQSKPLIGSPDWEFKLGTGMVRGLRWGTVSLRAALANSAGSFEPGEYAFEYLRRLTERVRVFAAIEGSEDEVELITEAQLSLGQHVILKVNNAFGVTSKAPDWAPEVGLLIAFPRR